MRITKIAILAGLLVADSSFADKRSLGIVVGWGYNFSGSATGVAFASRFATGVVTKVEHPLNDVVAIAAGGGNCLAIRADGTVVAWGGRYRASTNAVIIGGDTLRDVVAVSASEHNFALRRNGTVAVWDRVPYRRNENGEPVFMPGGLTDIVAIAAGSYYDLALKKDGTIVSWGRGNHPPDELTNTIAIAVSDDTDGHGLALAGDHTVTAWGLRHNSYCKVRGITNAVAIAAGSAHYLALNADGTVAEWGDYYPAVARSTLDGEPAVNLAMHLAVVGEKVLSNVAAISARGTRSMALKRDGTVVLWGRGHSRFENPPVQLDVPAGLSGVIAVSAGNNFSLAITTNSAVAERFRH